MASAIPCPCCGTEHGAEAASCRVCGYDLTERSSQENVAPASPQSQQCARCGASLAPGEEACDRCGLVRSQRRRRPWTAQVQLFDGGEGGASPGTNPGANASEWTVPVVSRSPAQTPTTLEVAPPARVGTGQAQGNAQVAGKWRIVVVDHEGREGSSLAVPAGGLAIGRQGCALSFPDDPFMSPQHAQIFVRANGLEIVDLGSRNGVYVRIEQRTAVRPGDTILVGRQLLRLEELGPSLQSAHREDTQVQGFGSLLEGAWGRLTRIALGEIVADAFLLNRETMTLGRDAGELQFVGDNFVSRRHARISRRVDGGTAAAWLEDLGSANGTYLRLRDRAMLGAGTLFRVGDEVLLVRND